MLKKQREVESNRIFSFPVGQETEEDTGYEGGPNMRWDDKDRWDGGGSDNEEDSRGQQREDSTPFDEPGGIFYSEQPQHPSQDPSPSSSSFGLDGINFHSEPLPK